MDDCSVTLPFSNRAEAGRLLGRRLQAEHLPRPLVVVALPRGGVPVAAEVARCLGAPVDLLIVRKIGAPWQRELAVAAVVDGTPPEIVIDEDIRRPLAPMPPTSSARPRSSDARSNVAAKPICTGAHRWPWPARRSSWSTTASPPVPPVRAALKASRRRGAANVVQAMPVAPHDTVMALRGSCDHIVCLAEPQPFHAVGAHYVDFHQVDDAEVMAAFGAEQRE